MKKSYLFLMMLFVQLIMGGKAFAADPPQAEYEAALAAIPSGAYYITTEVDGVKYYVTASGSLEERYEGIETSEGLFTINQVSGGALYTTGWHIEGANGHFSNTTLTNNLANLHPGTGVFRLDTGNNRNDWESQVFYMNEEGKIAIRSCNTAYGESSWADAGRAFWTYQVDEVGEIVWSDFGPMPAYSYEPAYIWTLEQPAGKEQVYLVLNNVYSKYEDYIWEDVDEPEILNFGTDFGQLTDLETWVKFWNLMQEVSAICDKFVEPDYDYYTDPNAPTLEDAEKYAADADSLYQVILDSEVPYTMENGYYRIFTAERYKSNYDESGYVDKAIAASFDKVNHENKSIYGTVRRDFANYVWKLTKSESGDSIMIQNVGMGTYISKSATSEFVMMTEDENDAAHLVFDYAGPKTVAYASAGGEIVEDERDIFAIRLASEPRGGSYIHQYNHGTPNEEDWSDFGYSQTDTGVEQDLKFWIRTYTRDAAIDNWTSEWYLEPVSAEEVAELEEAFGPIKNHELLVQMNQQLRDKVLKAMDAAKDLTLIKKVDQLSSPHSDPDEGKDLGALIDNVSSTFWHTTWHGYAEGVTGMMYYGEDYGEAGRECHYLQISGMQEMVGECELYWRERESADNDRPTKIVLMGAESANTPNDEWVEMAVVDIPNSDKGAENHIPLNIETAYPFVRILVIEVNSSFRSFWHASEIQFKLKTPGPTSQFVVLGEVATTLESTYLANLEIADADITIEDYNALLEAYNAFMEYMVDPTELRTALSNYSKATEGVVEGQNPGQWADVTVPNQYNELYAEVDAYNKAGRYKAAQIHKYAVMLKAMQKSVMEKANVVETDKWYRIMVPTEEMYDAYGFSKEGVDKANDLIEDQWNVPGTFVTTAKLESEEETYIDDETGEEKTRTTSWLEAINGEDVRESNRLFFMPDDDIEDKAVSMFRFVEKEAEGVDYAPLFIDAKENMIMALDMSNSYTRVDTLINKASQLSSNASDSSEGQHIEYLIDGKSDTFWHSDWHKNVIAPPYLQVAFDEPVSGLVQVEITRRNNGFGHIVRMFIVGSNDGETWTNIGYLEAPYGGTPGETIACLPVNLEGSYKYLRFINTCRWLNGGGNSAEMDPFAEPKSADEYDVTWTYFHAAEFQLYSVVPAKEPSASAQALQEAYTTANKILIKDVTAEDLAATAGAYRAFRSEFNAEEGKDVLPYGIDKVAPVYAIQNKATGLFVNANNGNGGNTNDVNLRTIPTFFDYKALGYERSLMHGTQINGTTPNNLHVGESNRRLCTWTTTEATTNSGLVIVEADEEYAAPESFSFFKDIKPGRIADWCHSVTITPVEANDEEAGGAYMVVGQFTEGEDEDAETFIALQKIAVIEAGKPALYILGDTTSYDAEDEYVEPMKFTISGAEKPVVESTGVNGLIGTLVPVTLDKYEIFFNGNHAECKEGQGLTACSAYLDLEVCPQTNPGGEYDFKISLGKAGNDVADGVKDVSSALENISKPGNVYSMDGKLLRTNATLNSLKTMGKGMYILNGVKVIVK